MRQILFLFLLLFIGINGYGQNLELAKGCKQVDAIYRILVETIEVGAPTYNSGNYAGCYKIYEGASYKILHLHGKKCKLIRQELEEALERAHESKYNAGEKAWILRLAFDNILGVPTTTGERLKRS